MHLLHFSCTCLPAEVGKARAEMKFKCLGKCLVKIHKSDGIKDLYQDFNVSLQGIIIYQAAYFHTDDAAKEMFPDPQNTHVFISWMITQSLVVVVGMTSYLSLWGDAVRRAERNRCHIYRHARLPEGDCS